MNEKLSVSDISFQIAEKEIINNISLKVNHGNFVGIIGPNGSGKSTILRNIYRAIKPNAGAIYLDGKNLQDYTYKETAKKLAVLRQESESDFDYSVKEMVEMGRAPHHGLFEPDTQHDSVMVQDSLKKVGMQNSSDRMISTLSGGEKQRVLIARTLAQETDFILLDEPTNHLDIYYRLQLMDLFKNLEVTVLAVIHDLELAAKYCDYIYVIDNGRVFSSGTPRNIFTNNMFESVFRVQVNIRYEDDNSVQIKYLGICESYK